MSNGSSSSLSTSITARSPNGRFNQTTHGAIRVLGVAGCIVVIVLVATTNEYPYVHLVVSFVEDGTAHPVVIAAQSDPKLELADIPLAKAKRAAHAPPAFWRPLLEPLRVRLRIELDHRLAIPIQRPPFPPPRLLVLR